MTTAEKRAWITDRLIKCGFQLCSRNDHYAVDSRDGSVCLISGLTFNEVYMWTSGFVAGRDSMEG